MIRLSKRLMKVAEKVKKNSYIIDVGSDHALIPMYLVQNGLAKKAIATDIRSDIVKRMKEVITYAGFTEKIEVLVADGLLGIYLNKVSTIIITGMGGYLIRDILSKRIDYIKNKTLILQPQNNEKDVRVFLHNNGFKIIDEDMIEDRENKFYTIIVAKKGRDSKYGEEDYTLGKKLIEKKSDDFIKYLNYRVLKVERALSGIKEESRRRDELLNLLDMYKNILEG